MKKSVLITIVLLIGYQTEMLSQSCLPEGITFTTQSQIDKFQLFYPNCTEIEGDVIIEGQNIINLNGLNVLTFIGGNLRIGRATSYYSNPNLTSLSGLDNVTSIGGYLLIQGNFSLTSLTGLENINYVTGGLLIRNNHSLTDLSGLDNLDSIGGSLTMYYNNAMVSLSGLDNVTSIGGGISIGEYHYFGGVIGNRSLTSLSGLENLTTIGGSLGIYCNVNLTSLTALNNLASIGGGLEIGGNDSLPNLTGLDNLTSIQGSISIGFTIWNPPDPYQGVGNPSLTSLTGIDNIEAATIQTLHIYSNPLLSTCEVSSICEYLASPGGTIDIHDNATGCNSRQEVRNACATIAINEIGFEDEFSMFPVPVESTLTISSKNSLRIDEIVIYNQIGQNVLHHKPVTQTIDISTLHPGMYVIEVVCGNRKMRGKFIK